MSAVEIAGVLSAYLMGSMRELPASVGYWLGREPQILVMKRGQGPSLKRRFPRTV